MAPTWKVEAELWTDLKSTSSLTDIVGGACYRLGGGIGLNMFSTLVFHELGHHKLERWVPLVAIVHADMSAGYALPGSRQSNHDGW